MSTNKVNLGAAVLEPGSIKRNKTGSWRVLRPVRNKELCNKCMICWQFCPDNAINKDLTVDYDYCKGCGICAQVCPRQGIKMVKEEK